MEKFKEGSTGKGTATPNPKFNFSNPKFVKINTDLEKISDLNITHPARVYLEKRGIKDLDYFYYCPKFKEWTNKQKKTFDTLRQDSDRIIIPFKDKQGNLFGYQGRSLAPKAKIRYITIMLDEEQPKIFGLDRVNTDKPIYITEGPLMLRSLKTRLPWLVPILILGRLSGAIIFGFLITNHAIERSSPESPKLLTEETR